jgi:hypothetical protein
MNGCCGSPGASAAPARLPAYNDLALVFMAAEVDGQGPEGGEDRVRISALSDALGEEYRKPELVFLSACRTGEHARLRLRLSSR